MSCYRKNSEPTDPVVLRLQREGQTILIEIRDRGVGIPPAEINRIFEPFYRVDKSRNRKTGGFGLGLSLVKKIMQAHQGSVEILSKENLGTQVRLTFPTQAV